MTVTTSTPSARRTASGEEKSKPCRFANYLTLLILWSLLLGCGKLVVQEVTERVGQEVAVKAKKAAKDALKPAASGNSKGQISQQIRDIVEGELQDVVNRWSPGPDHCYYSVDRGLAFRFRCNTEPKFRVDVLTEQIPPNPNTGWPVMTAYRAVITPDNIHAAAKVYWGKLSDTSPKQISHPHFLAVALRPWTEDSLLTPVTLELFSLTNDGKAVDITGEPYEVPNDFVLNQTRSALNGLHYQDLRMLDSNGNNLGSLNMNELAPLETSELRHLINHSGSATLSNEGKRAIEYAQNAFPQMACSQHGSYLLLSHGGHYSGEISLNYRSKSPKGGLSIYQMVETTSEALRRFDLIGRQQITQHFEVTEVRGGGHQVWLFESSVSEIDKLNGVTYQASCYVAVRGFHRTRRIVFSVDHRLNNKAKPRLEAKAPWGDWSIPTTFANVFVVEVKRGKTTWRSLYDGLHADEAYPDLSNWMLSSSSLESLASLSELSSESLSEPAPKFEKHSKNK